mgnify:CR=1 FL=1
MRLFGKSKKIVEKPKVPTLIKNSNILEKPWGTVETLADYPKFELRKITILPGQETSMHRHFNRREYWWVESGGGVVEVSEDPIKYRHKYAITSDKEAVINKGQWHKIINNSTNTSLVIVEFAIGTVEEEDIERLIDGA